MELTQAESLLIKFRSGARLNDSTLANAVE